MNYDSMELLVGAASRQLHPGFGFFIGTTAALIGAGLAAAGAAGGALGSKSKQTSQSQYNNTSSVTPNLLPQQKSLYDALYQQALGRANGQTPGLQGYSSQGLQNINAASEAARQNTVNRLASSGLLSSPVAAASGTQADIARAGQSANFLNSLPLLQNQLQIQNLGVAGDIFRLPGVGSTSTSSGSGTNTTTGQQGGGLGGALGGLGSSLGFLYGMGAFGGGGGGNSPNGYAPGIAPYPTLQQAGIPSSTNGQPLNLGAILGQLYGYGGI